jgi:phosphatidyl-myo-inositol dimannoside synthase
MNHLFVTQDYLPDLGGMARRHVELVRRFPEPMAVSTVANPLAGPYDAVERYPIERQRFPFSEAKYFTNQIMWGRWLTRRCRRDIDVIHCGNVRPVGYAVWWGSKRSRVPYLLYVNGGDLLRERHKAQESRMKHWSARVLFRDAIGIVATSKWVAQLTEDVMRDVGVSQPPPVAEIHLGTDPSQFRPDRDGAAMRAEWGVGDALVLVTIARLVPHKGQDMVIRAVAELREEFPDLRYVIVGEGEDRDRLNALASGLGVGERIHMVGALRDTRLPAAYAAATLYVGLSRVDRDVNAEGFGISFLEASAAGVAVLAGDSGGVRSAVRDGETGFVVDPTDLDAITSHLRRLLSNDELRRQLGTNGRHAVESHYNWDRVARDTLDFTRQVMRKRRS